MAAKRSRDARRMKENQIALRAGFLEKEVSFLTEIETDIVFLLATLFALKWRKKEKKIKLHQLLTNNKLLLTIYLQFFFLPRVSVKD